MKQVTMLEFRRHAQRVLRQLAKGERFVLSHRGKPAARLEPVHGRLNEEGAEDPFRSINHRATASPKGKTTHAEIVRILYGGR